MATVDATESVSAGKQTAAAPSPRPACRSSFPGADLALRALLFAVTLTGLVVLATAEPTVRIPPVPHIPGLVLSFPPSMFEDEDSPLPLMYLLVAVCMTGFYYSLLTALTTLVLSSSSPAPLPQRLSSSMYY